MTGQLKLISVEEAAKMCGWKLPTFEQMLAKPMDARGRPKYLHILDDGYLDLEQVKKYVKRSKERQLQAPIVSDELLIEKLEVVRRQMHGVKNAAIIVLSSFAGLRVGEIASLKVLDVMNDDGSLKEKTFFTRDLTKTRQSRNVYLVDPTLIKYLQPYLRKRAVDEITTDSPLFEAPRGGFFDGNNLAQYMKRCFKAVGLPNLSSHSGRAATATRYLRKGKTLKFVGQILGHSSTATTAKYDRVTIDEVLDEMKKG